MGFSGSKELGEQIPLIWERIDEIQKESSDAKKLAKRLNKDLIEAELMSRQAKETSERVETNMQKFEERIDEKFNILIEMQRSQFYKMIGLIIFSLGTFISVGLAFWK